jgi:hypothetical protein
MLIDATRRNRKNNTKIILDPKKTVVLVMSCEFFTRYVLDDLRDVKYFKKILKINHWYKPNEDRETYMMRERRCFFVFRDLSLLERIKVVILSYIYMRKVKVKYFNQ